MKKACIIYGTFCTNIRIIEVPDGEEGRKGQKGYLKKKKNVENFPSLGRDLDIQVHKANRLLHYLSAKRPSPRYIIMKLSKIKDKYNLKTSKGKKGRKCQKNLH